MATTIYGLDWFEGDGLNYAYTELADAKLDVLEYLLTRHIDEVSAGRYDVGYTEESADTLACDSISLIEDEYVDDIVNITYLDLKDNFKLTP